jgi:hypothetical protein
MNYSAKALVIGFNCCALCDYSPPYLKAETLSEPRVPSQEILSQGIFTRTLLDDAQNS